MPQHQRTLRCIQTAREKGFAEGQDGKVVIVKDYQGPRIQETSITTEKQGEEYVEYDEKDVKNEYVEYDEKDVKHEVKTEEDGVEEAVAAAVTGEEEVSEAAEREIIQIQVGRRRRRRRTIRGVARRTVIGGGWLFKF